MANPVAAAASGFFSGLSTDVNQNAQQENDWSKQAVQAFDQNYKYYQKLQSDYSDKQNQIDGLATQLAGDKNDQAARAVANSFVTSFPKENALNHMSMLQTMYVHQKQAYESANQKQQADSAIKDVKQITGANQQDQQPQASQQPQQQNADQSQSTSDDQSDTSSQPPNNSPGLIGTALGVNSGDQRNNQINNKLSSAYQMPLSQIIKIRSGQFGDLQKNTEPDLNYAPDWKQMQFEEKLGNMGMDALNIPDALHGQKYLEELSKISPDLVENVQLAGDGKIPQPTSKTFGMKGISLLAFNAMVKHYNPTYDANTFAVRKAMEISSTSGTMGNTASSLSMVIKHIGQLEGNIKELDNLQMPIANVPTNWWKNNVQGYPGVTDFHTTADAVVTEIAKTLKGAGVVNEQEINEWRQQLGDSRSPIQYAGVLHNILGLLSARFEPMQSQYQRGMNPESQGGQFISPGASQTLSKLGTNLNTEQSTAPSNNVPTFSDPKDPELLKLPSGSPFMAPGPGGSMVQRFKK